MRINATLSEGLAGTVSVSIRNRVDIENDDVASDGKLIPADELTPAPPTPGAVAEIAFWYALPEKLETIVQSGVAASVKFETGVSPIA
jgi:hypothetical protein